MYVFLEGVHMTVAQITFTQHVTNVLRNIAHKRRTGLLRIEHVRVQAVEKGEICFEGGKVVHARVGQQVGERALLRIVNWDQVFFAFLEGGQPPRRNGGSPGQSSSSVRLLPAVQREERRTLPVELPAVVQADSSSIEKAANLGVYAVFHVQPAAATKQVMSRMERQDRIIFMLLDGKRTVRDLAKLIHRSELAVASVLARLLKNGYIECAGSNNR
jgi:Domain of unknown function (DUF4388)